MDEAAEPVINEGLWGYLSPIAWVPRWMKWTFAFMSCGTILVFLASSYILYLQVTLALTRAPTPSFTGISRSVPLGEGKCRVEVDTLEYVIVPPLESYVDECDWPEEIYVEIFPCRTTALKAPPEMYFFKNGGDIVQCDWQMGYRIKSQKDVLFDRYAPFFVWILSGGMLVTSHGVMISVAGTIQFNDQLDAAFAAYGGFYQWFFTMLHRRRQQKKKKL